jgi:hypothetical protein
MLSEKRIRKIIKDEINRNISFKIEQAAEKGVLNALKSFGVNVENHQEIQKDFHFLSRLRKRSEESSYNLMKTLISVGVFAALIALWEGIKNNLK